MTGCAPTIWGQKTFELNRLRAEKEISRLGEDKKARLAEKQKLEDRKARMAQDRELFREYDYDAHRKYQTAAENARAARAQLERLKKAQENNQEYLELNELVGRLSDEQKAVQSEYGLKLQEKSGQDSTIVRCAEKIEVKSAELNEQEECYRKYQIEHYTIVQRTVEAYEKYTGERKKGYRRSAGGRDQTTYHKEYRTA